MGYYCDVCDKTIKSKFRSKHLESLTHKELDNSIHIKHTIEYPNFFDINEKFHEYIHCHSKNVDLNRVKCEFKKFFDEKLIHKVNQVQEIIQRFCV